MYKNTKTCLCFSSGGHWAQPTPTVCTLCGKECTSRWKLQRHMTVHTGERQFTCPFCTRKFSQQANLKTHVVRCHPEVGSILWWRGSCGKVLSKTRQYFVMKKSCDKVTSKTSIFWWRNACDKVLSKTGQYLVGKRSMQHIVIKN